MWAYEQGKNINTHKHTLIIALDNYVYLQEMYKYETCANFAQVSYLVHFL